MIEKQIIQALLFKENLGEIYNKIDYTMFENEDYAFIFKIGQELRKNGYSGNLTEIFQKLDNDYREFYKNFPIDDLFVGNVKNVYILVDNFLENYLKRYAKKQISLLNFDLLNTSEILDKIEEIRRHISQHKSSHLPTIDEIKKDIEIAVNGNYEKLIKTGFNDFDKLLNGGYRTGISFIGAFTKVGKSCFARSLGYNVSRNHKVAYFNFEMDKYEFFKKMLKVYQFYGVMTPEESVEKIVYDNEQNNLLILNQHSRKLKHVKTTIEYLRQEHGINFFIIDTFDKLLNDHDDSWYGFTKNILELEELALNNNVVILALKQLNVETHKWVKNDDGRYYKKRVDPKCVRPSVQDSVGTKEPARTASSFITMYWNESDRSIVHFVEQCERYNTAGAIDFKFYKDSECYREIENSLEFL